MIIWRGLGWAVAAITFAVLVLSELGIERLFADERDYQTHGWPKLFALGVSAALVWMLAAHLKGRPGRVVIDKATGEELTLNKDHDLFFIPVRYWPIVLVALGVGFVLFE